MKIKLIPDGFLLLFLAILICLIITKLFVFPRLSSTISQKPLVTNESIKKINKIQITQGDPPFSLMLEKKNTGWNLTLDKAHHYPVTDRMIENLLNQISIKRTLYAVGPENGLPYGIGTKESLYLSLRDSNDTIMKTIIFGDSDIAGDDIYILISGKKEIMRTQNTFSDFLTIATSAWVDLSIFSKQLQENQIVEIRYSKDSNTKKFRSPGDSEIIGFTKVIESLTCVDITNINLIPSETITITFGDTHTLQISLAALNDDIWILKDETEGLSYIISSAMKENIERSLN